MQQTDYLGFSDDLRRVLSHLPPLQAILESGLAIEDMRQGVEQYLLTRMVRPTDPTSQSPLEWVLRRESTHLLSGFILPRNESASGFSLMTYLHALCSRTWKTEYESLPEPSKGFLRELEHLVRGVAGTTDVYDHAAGLHTPVS